MEADRQLFTVEDIVDLIAIDSTIDVDTIQRHMDELESVGYVRTRVLDDLVGYHAKEGLTWSETKNISDQWKKKILLQMIPNPKTFFVLFNTQKGKAKILSSEIKAWATNTDGKKVVAIVMLDNDLTLGDQSAESFAATIGKENIELFTLSSSNKVSVQQILTHIDAYSMCHDYKMPLIMALSNDAQCKKVLQILSHVRSRHEKGRTNLMYGLAWDEADKIYPQLREKKLDNGTCIRDFTTDDSSLYRLGFVTATEGVLLDEEYPECANAYMYPAEISEDDEPFYRAFHHEESIKRYIPCPKSRFNNDIALELLDMKSEYFETPLKLASGELYYRKIIINSNVKGTDMTEFAREITEREMHAMVFNQTGLTVYRNGDPPIRLKIKKRWFASVLFYAYKRFGLHTMPLVIIGRRKVDRGLGFTYAPRRGKVGPLLLDEGMGPITTDGIEGLVWTDMFLGHIDDKATAVQKAGRLAAIVAQCPQYPGALTWWTDEATGHQIDRHCRIVDAANEQVGANTMLQAFERAKVEVPVIPLTKRIDYGLSRCFDTPKEAKKWCAENLTYPSSEYQLHKNLCTCTGNRGSCGTTHIKYRGELRPLYSESEIRASPEHGRGNTDARIMPVTTTNEIGQGANTSARIMPLTIGTSDHARIIPVNTDIQWGTKDTERLMPVTTEKKIVWIVIYKLDKLKPQV